METCLRLGQEDGKSQFPVLENGKVVGIITATEIFSMAAHIIGAWDNYSGVTLQAATNNPGDVNTIATLVDECGARLKSIYPIPKTGEKHKRIVVRFETDNLETVTRIFEDNGFSVLEKNFQGEPVVDSHSA